MNNILHRNQRINAKGQLENAVGDFSEAVSYIFPVKENGAITPYKLLEHTDAFVSLDGYVKR
jgi:hypothetical protein